MVKCDVSVSDTTKGELSLLCQKYWSYMLLDF